MDSGSLLLRGEDTGPQVKSTFGAAAYEYGVVVNAGQVSKLLLLLDLNPFDAPALPQILQRRFDEGLHHSFEDFRRWLKSNRIRSEFWSRVDD
ncbi:MAG TPA: hypothetical protein VJ935_01135 [Acidimicrobiia bacterium]|nr:hypothetical protein [Acidimicrobiia bacterium]